MRKVYRSQILEMVQIKNAEKNLSNINNFNELLFLISIQSHFFSPLNIMWYMLLPVNTRYI